MNTNPYAAAVCKCEVWSIFDIRLLKFGDFHFRMSAPAGSSRLKPILSVLTIVSFRRSLPSDFPPTIDEMTTADRC